MTRTRKLVHVPAVAGVLLVALTACGGSASPADSVAPQSTSASTRASVPASAPASASETPTPTAEASTLKVLTEAALKKTLLDLNDLPPGFTLDTSNSSETDKTFCDYKPPFNEKIKVASDFTNEADLALVSSTLRQYATADQAKASFAALVDEMKTCKSEEIDGSKVSYAVMSVPHLGDGSLGLQIKGDGYTGKQNFVLSGPTVIATGGVGLSAQQVADLLKLQVQRYSDAAH